MGRINADDGVELRFVDVGDGPPIVFVHGWMMSSDVWRSQVEHFSPTNRVLAPDLRGCGQSGSKPGTHNMARFAADLDQILTKLQLEGVTLVGWSMGGGVSLEYLTKFGAQRIARLGIIDFPPRLEEDPNVADKVCTSLSTKRETFLDSFLRRMFLAPPPMMAFERLRNAALRCDPQVACEMYRAMRPTDPPVAAPSDLPALLVFPKKGWFPQALEEWKQRFPTHVAPEFIGSKHLPFMEEASHFNQALSDFVPKTSP